MSFIFQNEMSASHIAHIISYISRLTHTHATSLSLSLPLSLGHYHTPAVTIDSPDLLLIF
jgi:hypothetical protein